METRQTAILNFTAHLEYDDDWENDWGDKGAWFSVLRINGQEVWRSSKPTHEYDEYYADDCIAAVRDLMLDVKR